MYKECAVCGHDYYDHRADDMTCPRQRPYIAGLADVWDYQSGTTYTPRKDDKSANLNQPA